MAESKDMKSEGTWMVRESDMLIFGCVFFLEAHVVLEPLPNPIGLLGLGDPLKVMHSLVGRMENHLETFPLISKTL